MWSMSSCLQEMFCTVRKEIYATDKHKESLKYSLYATLEMRFLLHLHIERNDLRLEGWWKVKLSIQGANQNIILSVFFPSDSHQSVQQYCGKRNQTHVTWNAVGRFSDIQLCMSNSIISTADAFHSFHICVVQNSLNYIFSQTLFATCRLYTFYKPSK